MGENCCPDADTKKPSISRGNQGNVVIHSQNLHETQNADTVVTAEDRDKIIKEPRGPSDFRKQQEHALEYDEEVVDDGEHRAAWLKGYTISQGSLWSVRYYPTG